MNSYEIAAIIEDFAPAQLAAPWDCAGFAADLPREVGRVMLALTVTDDVVRQAREAGADMIVSHHPLFFVPVEYNDMPIYCAHTNLDKAHGGTTDTLIKTLGYSICHPEPVSGSDTFLRWVKLDAPISITDFSQKLKTISNNVRLVNNKNISQIRKIAFCAGSGSDFIAQATADGADAFVTGDIKFHAALESDIVLFDIGHFESEIPVLKTLADLLPIETIFAKEKSPFANI
jgi:dinuclear metal center YbgI/SA1388 family protein